MTAQNVTEQVSDWVIESKYSTVQFRIRSLFLFTVEGTFSEVSGAIRRDAADIGRSIVEAVIRADSLSTGNRRRDAHLRAADFLDVERYPEIRFQSSKVEKGKDRDTLRIEGRLTIKEKSSDVVIDVTEFDHSLSPQGQEIIYYTARTQINRLDYGITRRRWLTGDTLTITSYIQAMKV